MTRRSVFRHLVPHREDLGNSGYSPKPGRARRRLERAAPQDRDLGLAGVRGPGVRDRQRGRDQDARPHADRSRRVRPRRPDDRRTPSPSTPTSWCSSRAQRARPSDPAFRAVVADVAAPARRGALHASVRKPLRAGQPRADLAATATRRCCASRSPGNDNEVKDRVEPALTAVAAAQAAHPGFTVGEFGDASAEKQIDDVISDDFKKALVTSLPITLIILLIAFGALVAASVPLLLALTAVIGDDRPDRADQPHLAGVDSSINEVILLIGLAVGVDYSMFYLRREREERERGRSEEASLAAAAATSGRAVMVSGFTVMIAMAGMYLAGAPDLRIVRHRHDHRRRRGGRRLADGAARDPRVARRPGREGRRPDHQGHALERGRERALGAVLNPVLRHPVISVLVAGGRAGRARDPGVQPPHREPERRVAAAEPRGRSRPTTRSRPPSPAARSRRSSRSAPTT